MKHLVNPLLWFVVLQLGGLAAMRCRCWAAAPRGCKLAWYLVSAALVALVALSIPLTQSTLERALVIEDDARHPGSPAFIFVLGGGFVPGASPAEDALVTDNTRRVLTAIAWWHKHPDARLVFAGSSAVISSRRPERMVELMAEMAAGRGVPRDRLLLDSRSTNTREHALEALTLPGIVPQTRIGLVTSGWHMRRAKKEFGRYFANVRTQSVPLVSHPVAWRDFIPDPGVLSNTTRLLKEWAGLAWYALT